MRSVLDFFESLNELLATYLSRWLRDCWKSPPFALASAASVRFVFKDGVLYLNVRLVATGSQILHIQDSGFALFIPVGR